jgi:hypothetical protein
MESSMAHTAGGIKKEGPKMAETMTQTVWLVCRSDLNSNLDIVKREDGRTPAWNLTEEDADELIAYLQRNHRKQHGQTYDKMSYPKGTLWDFVNEKQLRC